MKRLQTEKQWLEEQMNPVLQSEGCIPLPGPPMGARSRLRHLSSI